MTKTTETNTQKLYQAYQEDFNNQTNKKVTNTVKTY